MSDMRLIKRSGSKLSVSDRAYIQFNSYEGGFEMSKGYMPKCERCGGRFTLNCLSVYDYEWHGGPLVLGFPSVELGGRMTLCSGCKESLEIDGYVFVFVRTAAHRAPFFLK